MKSANDEFYDKLEKEGVKITKEQREQINYRLNSILNYEPKVGVFGKTGAGKSSLCNALFGQDICPISDVEACTREPNEVMLNLGGNGIVLVDVPGVGESSERDEEYGKLYASLLPELDLVLWVLKADDRALASDQMFYKNIVKSHIDEGKPFFFVLNQVDKIEPFREWDEDKHEPGPRQFQNIDRKVKDVASYFDVASSSVIAVSANEKYNLVELVDRFVRALPKEKKITVYKAVNEEFQSKATGKHVEKSFKEVVAETIQAVVGKVVDGVVRVAEKAIEVFADKIGDILSGRFPIGGGRGGCYITTAICRNDNKPDNCYELETFRKFRDEWLINEKDGKKLIRRYYQVAPTIVSLIDKSDNKDEVYKEIKSKYLDPCLAAIEADDMKLCKDTYVEMVNDLIDRYLLWA